jgi:N-acetyl-gamma-glutamyl-phosphate reductase
VKAAVVGASGYLGAELLRLLAAHPSLEVVAVQADTAAGEEVGALYPALAPAYRRTSFGELDPAGLSGCDVVFVAVPAGRSQELVSGLVGSVGCVVDLGPDFRLRDASCYPTWYGFEHRAPELLAEAAYGLPELGREPILGARLVASPGCYVTAAALALAPLVAAGAIERRGVVVDALSGTSGAGRAPSPRTHHAAVNESAVAYGLVGHRHTPEMEQAIGAEVIFTPHLVPMTRGILATCYARATGPTSSAEVSSLLREAYEGEQFVEVVEDPPATRDTYGANTCRLAARHDERTGTTIVLAALDNLTKGGAGQAIQAANLALGLPEAEGLPKVALTP